MRNIIKICHLHLNASVAFVKTVTLLIGAKQAKYFFSWLHRCSLSTHSKIETE